MGWYSKKPFSLSRCTRFAFSLHQQLIMSVCQTSNHQQTSPHSWPTMNSRLTCWSCLWCFRTANHASLCLHLLLCVWMCLFWPVALVCSPVFPSLCALHWFFASYWLWLLQSYSQWDSTDLPLCEAYQRRDNLASPSSTCSSAQDERDNGEVPAAQETNLPHHLNGHGTSSLEKP